MPVVETKKTATVQPPTVGRAVPIGMKTAVVESRFVAVQDLLSHIEGGRLVVDGFFQRLRAEDHARPQDITLEPAQQSYDRIQNLEMRLQGDLSHSIDDGTKEWTITGEAVTYPGLTPQTGDMIRMDVGQGTWGVMAILNSSPTSIHPSPPHRITFQLQYQMDEQWFKDLEEKVVNNYFFVMDFLRSGKNPFIIDKEHAQYRKLDQLFGTMISEYFRSFYSDVNKTLVVPGQKGGAYDPFLVQAVLTILDVTEHPILGDLTRHALDVQYAYTTTTIWDALTRVEPSYLYTACQRVGLVDKANMRDRGVFGGAYWAKFQKLVFPADRRRDADVQFGKVLQPDLLPFEIAGVPVTDLNRLIVNNTDTVNMELGDHVVMATREIPKIDEDKAMYYVFTKAFYDKDQSKLSQLEKLVWSVLEHNEIDIDTLYRLVDRSRRWDRLERFYFVPVLMYLCVLAFRGPSHR